MQGLTRALLIALGRQVVRDPNKLQPDPETMAVGRTLYEEGDLTSDIPSCKSCHGMPDTKTVSSLTPKIHGLNIDVVVSQLKRYKNGIRNNDEDGVMRAIAEKLSEEQIKSLSQYIWMLGAE